MKIVIYPHAIKVIDEVAAFVESKNTPGSGKRYATKFKKAIEKLAQPHVQHALCRNALLAQFGYSCAHYNDWVIAFRINNNVLTIYRIIHSTLVF